MQTSRLLSILKFEHCTILDTGVEIRNFLMQKIYCYMSYIEPLRGILLYEVQRLILHFNVVRYMLAHYFISSTGN